VVVNGGKGEGEGGTANSSIMEALLTMLLSDRFGALANESAQRPRSEQAEALRQQIRKDMEKKPEPKPKN